MAWLTGWSYRKSHVINPASGAGTNYQVRIVAHYGSGTDSGGDVYLNGKCRTDFGDIRFTKSDGTTLLDYWMESKTDSDNAVFWVEVADDLSTNAVTIYIYYGNATATTTSNGDATFILFDHLTDITGWSAVEHSDPDNNGWISVSQADATKVKGTISDGGGTYGTWGYICKNYDKAVNSRFKIAFYHMIDDQPRRYHDWGLGLIILATDGKTYRFSADFTDSESLRLPTADYACDLNNIQTLTAGVWYKHEFDPIGELAKKGYAITPSTVETIFAGMEIYNDTDNGYIDWIYIRKFVDPEPSHGSWGSQEAAVFLTESLGLKDSTVKASSVVKSELLGLSDVVFKNVSVAKAESLGLSDVVSAVRLFYQTLTELLGLSDVVAKAPSVVRAESLGLFDSYSRLWSVHRTYSENLGLADKVQKASSTVKTELLGLKDFTVKDVSAVKSERLGLFDAYFRTWTAYRAFTETLGLSDTVSKLTSVPLTEHLALLDAIAKSPFTTRTEALGLKDYVAKEASSVKSESLGLADTVGKETSRTFAEALGLSDIFTRTWTIQRALGESLGLKDALQKTPSTLKTEMLGLLDSYSRIWLAFRTYTESLGLSSTRLTSPAFRF